MYVYRMRKGWLSDRCKLTVCFVTGLPVTLIGPPMPHALSRNETYMGYTLPKGAAIINCVCHPYQLFALTIRHRAKSMAATM